MLIWNSDVDGAGIGVGACTFLGVQRIFAKKLSCKLFLRELNHYWNVKWTMKRPLHKWNHIMKLILQPAICNINTFLVLDRDTTRNNILKCWHLQRSYTVNTSLNFFVWSPGMSKLLKKQAVGLPETKNQQGRTFDETCRVHTCIRKQKN